MNTTLITFIHDDLKYESILVEHKELYEDFIIKLHKYQSDLELISLVDIAIFLLQNDYRILNKELFFNESEYQKSNLFTTADHKIELAFDLEITTIS